VHWFGDPDLPLTPTFIDDFGHTVAAVGAHDASVASVWHVPHPAPTTGCELAAKACRQSTTALRLLSHGPGQIRLVGWVWPVAPEGAELVYQFELPLVDGSRAAATFGITPTSYRDGIAATWAG